MKPRTIESYRKHSKENFLSTKPKHVQSLNDENDDTVVTTTKELQKNGKNHKNIIMPTLLPFKSLDDYVDPLLHLNIGLGNDTINHMRKVCQAIDGSEESKSKEKEKLEKIIKISANKLEDLNEKRREVIVRADEMKHFKMRLEATLAVEEDEDKENIAPDAEDLAEMYYRKEGNGRNKRKLEDREICNSQNCIIFVVDKRKKDMKITCDKCGKVYHWYCEAIHSLSAEVNNETYNCLKCQQYSSSDVLSKMHMEIKELESRDMNLYDDEVILEGKVVQYIAKLKNLMGPAEKELEESFKSLDTAMQAYHGGACNGKDIEKILEHSVQCQSLEDFIMTRCLYNRNPELALKFWTVWKIQANCWLRLRMPQGDHEHVLETIRVCQEWSKQLPLLFPERNITRKGHVLSIHVPEFLLKYPNLYYMFYKLEQRGEAIHALFNTLHRQRFQCIRPSEKRLLMLIEELEIIHAVDKSVTKARQYNKRVRS